MTRTSDPMNHSVSETIRVARIFCILLLVYAHAQPYPLATPDIMFSPEGVIYFLRLLLGHTSVPLLSVISGYLLAKTMDGRPYVSELRNKFFTLIVPMVLWNLIRLLEEYLQSGFVAVPALRDLPNALLALTAPPAMIPLYFLRDAFVCFLISPILIYMARQIPGTTAIVLLFNAVFNADGPMFINSAIPLFYFAGCVLQVRKTPIPNRTMPLWPVVVAGLAMLLLSAAFFYAPPNWSPLVSKSYLFSAADIALRVAGCVVFWAIVSRLVHSTLGTFLLRFEPIAFFVFCFHGIAGGIWWLGIQQMHLSSNPFVFMVYFVISPVLVLGTCVIAMKVLSYVAPGATKHLLGGRAPTPAQIAGMLRSLFSFWPVAPSKI